MVNHEYLLPCWQQISHLSNTPCGIPHGKSVHHSSPVEIAVISNLICKNLSGILDNMAPIITEQGLIRCGNRLVPEK